MEIILSKMNGAGNDFLIYDALKQDNNGLLVQITSQIAHLSSRDNDLTNGCDQFIIIRDNPDNKNSVMMDIHNQDGSVAEACGNATRCVVNLANKEHPELFLNEIIRIITVAGNLEGKIISESKVSVTLPPPIFDWEKIPLSQDLDIDSLPIEIDGFEKPSAVSIGNPHMVFFGDKDVSEINIEEIGPDLENHYLFPKKTNVSFANIIDNNNIRLRVFERGVGETQACGTAACATLVCAVKKGYIKERASINLPGGILEISWNGQGSGNITMVGETEFERNIKILI